MEQLFKIIPQEYFTKDLKKNSLGVIKVALLREATGNLIIRNNYADETTTFKISESKDVVEIPARKMKSREKLLGLKICRDMKVVDENVRYNVISTPNYLANPNSVLFGDSVTETNTSVALSSRIIYDWAYSIRDVSEITGILQHNALDEGGTMFDQIKGELRQSLYQVQYVKPGTLFPHFITFENITPQLFIHAISCILFESRYFAQSTTLSSANLKNHIIGIGYSKFEKPVNSYLISKKWNDEKKDEKEVTFSKVKEAIESKMKSEYGENNYKDGSEICTLVNNLWKDESKKELEEVYKQAKEDTLKFLKEIKVYK